MKIVLALALLIVALPAPAAWSAIVTPPGLGPGDQFRIFFVSSATHDGASSDIGVYDDFITGLANAAGLTYNGASVTWFALGSTESVAANSRLPASTASPGFYRVDGVKIADNTSDLWDASLDDFPAVTETGDVLFGAFVFTGTTDSGAIGLGPLGSPLIAFGFTSNKDDEGWVEADGQMSPTELLHFYGYSEVLTVPAAVPEPAALTLLGLGGLGLAGHALRRRRAR